MRSKVLIWLAEIVLLGFLVFLTAKVYIDAINYIDEAKDFSVESLTKLLKSALYMILFIVMTFYVFIISVVIVIKDKLFN